MRASLVRFLALGGDEHAPVHDLGVQLYGAWLTGPLDLEGATIGVPLVLLKCRVGHFYCRRSNMRILALGGCKLTKGLSADSLDCKGGVFLNQEFHSTGEIRLLAAAMGPLNCANGRFENDGGSALSCDGATITGDVCLDKGFHATGEVRLHGATISGDIICHGGQFENGNDRALSCDRATVAGNIFLSEGFRAKGQVGLIGTRIEGDLACNDGQFDNETGRALSCDGARVTGAMFFRWLKGLKGGVALSGMHIGVLCDDGESWKGATGGLVLDAFTYGRLAGGAPTSAAKRIDWLRLQRPDHLGKEFKPQPWEQVIAVLRATGHAEEARTVAVAKHQSMRGAGRYVGGSAIWDWIYGTLVGYGYRPWKLMKIAIGIWFVCMLAYWAAVRPTATGYEVYLLGPPTTQPNPSCLVQRAAARDPTPCPPAAPRYQDFFAPTYSLEVMLPVISLGSKEKWQPVVSGRHGEPLIAGHALRVLYWLQIAFGWIAGLLLVGILGNLIKKD